LVLQIVVLGPVAHINTLGSLPHEGNSVDPEQSLHRAGMAGKHSTPINHEEGEGRVIYFEPRLWIQQRESLEDRPDFPRYISCPLP
jgi:hypothetical protein